MTMRSLQWWTFRVKELNIRLRDAKSRKARAVGSVQLIEAGREAARTIQPGRDIDRTYDVAFNFSGLIFDKDREDFKTGVYAELYNV